MPKWFEVVVPRKIINQYHDNNNCERLTSFGPRTKIVSKKTMGKDRHLLSNIQQHIQFHQPQTQQKQQT
jgi:hypothetical protein